MRCKKIIFNLLSVLSQYEMQTSMRLFTVKNAIIDALFLTLFMRILVGILYKRG